MRAIAIGCVVGIGCGPAPHHLETQPAHVASGTPFDRAELALYTAGDVMLFTLAGNRVTKLATFHVADRDVDAIDWADREHLFAAAERHVVMITGAGTTPIAVPSEASLVTPEPATGDDLHAGGELGLAVTPGEAWWMKCAAGIAADGFQCTTLARVRLWPSPTTVMEEFPFEPPSQPDSWNDDPPAGFHVQLPHDHTSVVCSDPGGGTTILHGDVEHHEELMGVHWVSATPPRLLVMYGVAGYSDLIATHWTLHDGCTAQPLEHGSLASPGPDHVWVTEQGPDTDHGHAFAWRGATKLGELPTHIVRFRPQR